MNAASVLWAIREGNSDLDAICSKLRMTESLVYRYVDDLIKLGLVERVLKEHPEKQRHGVGEMPPVPRPLREAPLKQTAQWDRIAAALGISLSNLVFERDEMRVRPYFGGPRAVPSLGAFVAMAFRPELRPVYDDHILPVMKGLKLEARRADDFFSVNSVMGDIWKAINAAKIVIADCTGRNPNVFYEIGLAHTVGKPVVLISQSGDDVPFDLKAIRYIEYKYTPPGMRAFEKALRRTITETLKDLPERD